MNSLPPFVQNHLLETVLTKKSPAYLVADKEGELTDWGGELEFYGISGLHHGKPLSEQIDFLKGQLPLKSSHVLPWIKAGSGVTASVYLFAGDQQDCVLLLDATEDESLRRAMQQRVNDFSIMLHQQSQTANTSLLEKLLTALHMIVLQRVNEGVFSAIGKLPIWFARLYPDANLERSQLRPQDRFVFLQSFLEYAEDFWKSSSGLLKSGPWTEVDPTGKEWVLEASAISVESEKLLLIEVPGTRFDEKELLIQKGRESNLKYRAVSRDRVNLLKSEERHRALLTALEDDVFLLDEEGNYLEYILYDMPLEQKPGIELKGKNISDVLPEAISMQFQEHITAAMTSTEAQVLPYQMEINGQVRRLEAKFVSAGKGEVLVLIREMK